MNCDCGNDGCIKNQLATLKAEIVNREGEKQEMREVIDRLKAELTEAQGYIEGQDKEIISLQTGLRLVRKDRDQTREISQRRGLELASQRAENERLRQALTHISMLDQCEECEHSGHVHIADQALQSAAKLDEGNV